MPLRPEIEDALAVLAQHPAVSNVRVQSESPEQSVVVTADFDTNLPSTWRALGESPTGVRSSETVEIRFPVDYPKSAPYPTLRPDFNPNLPHINPHQKGNRVPPCIVHGGVLDVLHNEGIGRLVDQIAVWLEKAGEDRLIDKTQGWEPTRRSWTTDSLSIDADWLVERRNGLGRAQLYRVWSVWTKQGRLSIGRSPRVVENTLKRTDLLKLFNDVKSEESIRSGDTILAVCWPNSNGSDEPQIFDNFQPDTVATYADLKERAVVFGCDQALTHLGNNLDFVARQINAPYLFPVYVVLAIRRPFPIIGLRTDFELLAYRIDLPMPSALSSPQDVSVNPVSFKNPISTTLLRRTSGLDVEREHVQTSFVGCGSMGSKLVMHVARAGYAPLLLADYSNPSSHNAARHALHPSHLNSVFGKAHKLANVITEFGYSRPRVFDDFLQRLPFTEAKYQNAFEKEDSIIVNTTASPAVRTYLADAKFRARVMEACAVNFGSAGVLTLEGPERNPSTTDLMAYAYESMRTEGILTAPVIGKESLLGIGVGCNSVTLPMSDARISLIVAGAGQALLKTYQQGLPQHGQVAVAQVSEDGMSIQWRHHEMGKTHFADPSDAPTWTIRVLDSAHKKICEEIGKHKHVETGGLIVGRVSAVSREIVVIDVMDAPPDSKRSYASFILGTKGLAQRIEEYDASAAGVLWCLGTWHSHLRPEGPSPTDFATANDLQGKLKGAAVLLIRRPDGYSAVVREGRQ